MRANNIQSMTKWIKNNVYKINLVRNDKSYIITALMFSVKLILSVAFDKYKLL